LHTPQGRNKNREVRNEKKDVKRMPINGFRTRSVKYAEPFRNT